MVIFIAGQVGVGKTTLARALSKELGFFHYEVDETFRDVFSKYPLYEHHIQDGIPFPHDVRVKTFRRVIQDFDRLSKTNEHLIVDDVLHKKWMRNLLFGAAVKCFGGYVLAVLEVPEEVILERLSLMRNGHMLKEPSKMYFALKKEFEPFKRPDLVLENSGFLEASLDKLVNLAREKVFT